MNDRPTEAVFVAPPPEEELELVETGMVSYVRFIYPLGRGLSPERTTREIDHREPTKIAVPENCIGFFFFNRAANGSGGMEDISSVFYFGKRFTLAERKAKKLPGDEELLEELVYADDDVFVQDRYGNFKHICPTDIVMKDPAPTRKITDKIELD